MAKNSTQDTFFRLVRYAHSYRYPQPFLPWLYRIARNLARTYQESVYHQYVDREADLPETLIDEADPLAWVQRQVRQADLLKALARLSPEQRGVQLLAKLGGWVPHKHRCPGKITLMRGLRRLLDMLATQAIRSSAVAQQGGLPPNILAFLQGWKPPQPDL